MNSPNKIVIIGDGFIGSSLYNFLLNARYNVSIFNRHNLNVLVEQLSHIDCQLILNCSGIGHPSLLDTNPLEYNRELDHINRIIDIANNYKIFLIHFSSAAACGYNNDFEEKIYPINVNNTLYGQLKCHVENNIYNKLDEKTYIILRLFSVYGIGLKKQLFFDLFKKYQRNEHLFQLNSILDERNFISISDVLQSIEFIIFNKISKGVINISNDKPIKISSAIEVGYAILNKIYKKNYQPFITDGRNDFNNNFISMHPKISFLRYQGFNINSSLEENLNNYYLWLKNNFN
jgi:dTDP-glucose 4,6-dehydratase/UDP-glucose 4-epimerase